MVKFELDSKLAKMSHLLRNCISFNNLRQNYCHLSNKNEKCLILQKTTFEISFLNIYLFFAKSCFYN